MKLAILTDIHEDFTSLKKVIDKIEKSGFDKMICLGDISGFSVPYYKYQKTRNAHDCLTLLREKNFIIIPGNHDYNAAQMIPKTSTSFDFPDEWYDLDYQERFRIAKNEIWLHEENDLDPLYTTEDLEFLRSLPDYQVLNENGLNILFSHYVFPNLSGFIKGFYSEGSAYKSHFEFMEKHKCAISFIGHSHVRGFYLVFQRYFKHYRYKNLKLENFPICIGIPPVTRYKKRTGFCTFDMEKLKLQVIHC